MTGGLYLYHFTAHRQDAISHSITCEFDAGTECLVVSRGEWLEVLEVDEASDSLKLKLRHNCLGVVRGLCKLRAGLVDELIVSTQQKGCPPALLQLSFDSNGGGFCRRHKYFIPSLEHCLKRPAVLNCEFLEADPHGRAVYVSPISGPRYVCLKPERANAQISELETENDGSIGNRRERTIQTLTDNRPAQTFAYEMVPVSRGDTAGPAYAVMERVVNGPKQLALYEANAMLGTVGRIWAVNIDESCRFIAEMRGDASCLLVFQADENKVLCYSLSGELCTSYSLEDQPRFVKSVTAVDNPFVFVQLRSGDTVALRVNEKLSEITKFTINGPFPSKLKTVEFFANGFVFASAGLENAPEMLLQVSSLTPENMELEEIATSPTISPAISSSVSKTGGTFLLGTAQNQKTGIMQLQFGREVFELAETPLPMKPAEVFTAKYTNASKFDELIVLSFGANNAKGSGSTTVLGVGEGGSVEEVSEAKTGLASSVFTMNVVGMTQGLVQVHPRGLRYIVRTGNNRKVLPWIVSAKGTEVVCSAIDAHKVALALSDMSVVYFEEQNSVLLESQKRIRVTSPIKSVAIRETKLIIALDDDTVREYSLTTFAQTSIHNVQYSVSSLLATPTSLYVGHTNGMVSIISENDIAIRVLGTKQVRLSFTENKEGVIALSYPRVFFFATNTDNHVEQLHGCGRLVSLCSFSTEDIESNGLVGIEDLNLRVLQISMDTMQTGICCNEIEFKEDLSESSTQETSWNLEATLGFIRNAPTKYTYAFQKSRILTLSGMEVINATNVPGRIHAFVSCHLKQEDYLAIACDKKIRLYTYDNSGNLSLHHETIIDGECKALLAFKGLLLAAIKNRVVLFDCGQKQLLFQDEIILEYCTVIKAVKSIQNLVYIGDSRNSVTILAYGSENGFRIVASDPVNRSVATLLPLDPATVCIGDHYGNICVLRFVELEVLSAIITSASTGTVECPAEPYNLEVVAHFWVPDAIVQLHRGVLSSTAAAEVLVYIGLQGTIGVLVPFVSEGDHQSYKELEDALRTCSSSTEVLQFRNAYTPRCNVVDGDFCEQAVQHFPTAELDECLQPLGVSVLQARNKLSAIRARC